MIPRIALAPLAISLVLAAGVAASVVKKMELAEIVSNGELIFEGRVVATDAILNKKGTISTAVTVEVDRPFRGAKASEKLVFWIAGGELGGQGLVIPGMPRFHAGERMLLFLTGETTSGVRAPVGLGQGKFGIEVDPKTGAKRVSRALSDLEFLDPKTGKSGHGPDAEGFDYGKLTAEIESLVAADDARRAKAESRPSGGGKHK